MNRVNLEAIQKTAGTVQADPASAIRKNHLDGAWNLQGADGERPQFFASVAFEGGSILLESDQPTFQGGGGMRPSPIQYCLFGLAACFASSFVTAATARGVSLQSFEVAAEVEVNLSRSLGFSQDPPMKGMTLSLRVQSDATREVLEEIAEVARSRCPAVFCLTNPMELQIRMTGEEASLRR